MLCKYSSVNSKIITSSKAKISIFQRGFMFGDGAFETCYFNYQIMDFNLHYQRLNQSLQFLKINANLTTIEEDCNKIIKKNNIKRGIIKIIVSRGIGSQGYLPKKNIKPLIVISARHILKIDKEELILGVFDKFFLPSLAISTNNKTLNSINYILPKINANDNGYFDNILLNEKRQICEASSANIFWTKGLNIYTPALECGLLNGTKRQRVINYIERKTDFNLVEGRFYLSDLLDCDECFISNSSFLLLNIKKLVIDGNIIILEKDCIYNDIKQNAFS